MFSHIVGKQRQRKKETPVNKPAQADTEAKREMLTKKVYQQHKPKNKFMGWARDVSHRVCSSLNFSH